MRARFKTAFASRYPVGQHACSETTLERSKTRPAGSSISDYAKGAAILSVGKRSQSHLKWWAKKSPFFVLWKSKTRAKRQSCKDISSASSMMQAASLEWLEALTKQNESWLRKEKFQSNGYSQVRLINFYGTERNCQRWPIKPLPNALGNCAFSMETPSRFMTPQTHKLLNGLKALKSGQRIKSLFAVGRSQQLKPLFVAVAFCANEQGQPPNAQSREHKKDNEHR